MQIFPHEEPLREKLENNKTYSVCQVVDTPDIDTAELCNQLAESDDFENIVKATTVVVQVIVKDDDEKSDMENNDPEDSNCLNPLAPIEDGAKDDEKITCSASLSDIYEMVKNGDGVMPFSSILVSTVVNANDDVFMANELIKALESPKFKPINWEHKGNELTGNENIGVMINTKLLQGSLDNLQEVDPNNIDPNDLTGKLHIRQDGIIWSAYFPSYTGKIKQGLADKNLYVSMECFFNGFDYLLYDKNDPTVSQIIERNDATSDLTWSLRAYGGSGVVEREGKSWRVARVLKNVTFSGQGIVYHPANRYEGQKLSIIFDEPAVSTLTKNDNLVYEYSTDTSVGENMSEIVELNDKINELSAKVDELTLAVQTLETEKADLLIQIENKDATIEATNTALQTASSKLAEIEAKELGRSRFAELIEIAGEADFNYTEEDLSKFSEDTYNAVKTAIAALVKSGVSSQPKTTDQSVSGSPKSTDQSVTNQTNLTEASEELVDAIGNTQADPEESADLVISAGEADVEVALALIKNLFKTNK